MQSSAKALGHPVHQQLVVFPIGLLATAVVFDVLRYITDNEGFATASYYMIAAGILFGLLAAVFGAIDYIAVPTGTRARRIGAMHGLGNVVVVVLFAVSWLLRAGEPGHVPTTLAFVLALLGALLTAATGWASGSSRTRTWMPRRRSTPASGCTAPAAPRPTGDGDPEDGASGSRPR